MATYYTIPTKPMRKPLLALTPLAPLTIHTPWRHGATFFVLLFAASTVQKRKKRQRDEVNHLLPHDDPIVNEKGPFVKYGIMMSTMMAMADDDGVVEALSGVAALVRFHHGRANLILNFVSPISIPKGHCGIALFNEQTGSCSKGFLWWWRWFFYSSFWGWIFWRLRAGPLYWLSTV